MRVGRGAAGKVSFLRLSSVARQSAAVVRANGEPRAAETFLMLFNKALAAPPLPASRSSTSSTSPPSRPPAAKPPMTKARR
jgi:hypothetical protein